MKFDLHSDLANQITIENLKWHYEAMRSDFERMTLEEDRNDTTKDLEALDRVLDYFCGPSDR